jgi:hypothetical protein
MDLFLTPPPTHACILATCTDPCLHAGRHLQERIHVEISEAKTPPPPASFGTWLAARSELLTVCKYRNATLVYIPAQDTFYFASPATLLSPECPDATAVLGQFVLDNDGTARVLLFDLVRLRGVPMKDVGAAERYACLRDLQHTFGPACSLQWAGDTDSLARELRDGSFVVPHEVRGVMALGNVPGRMVVTRGVVQ